MGFMNITEETTDLAKSDRCVGLFSHSDQQRAAQTLTCQYASASNKGAGGRLADALAAGLEKPGRKTDGFFRKQFTKVHVPPCLFVYGRVGVITI